MSRPPVREWLAAWIERDPDPGDELDSLPGVLWHLSDAWARRSADNVELVHYTHLASDLDWQMRHLADRLHSTVPADIWPSLTHTASFNHLRARAERLAPGPVGILRDRTAFPRQGTSGTGAALLTPTQLEHDHRGTATLAAPDLLPWLHR